MIKSPGTQKIGMLALVLLITGAIDSIRNLPATALFGSTLIFFFVFSAIVFLIPVALVSAELSSASPDDEGGIYSWVKNAFGGKVAFLAIWLQWVNTLVWYPTILSFIAGTAAYLIDPALAQNKFYLVGVILAVFWSLTLISLKGLNTSAKFASFCAITGMLIPMGLIMLLAVFWLLEGHPMHVQFTAENMLPQLGHGESWVSLTAIMTAFLGMELAAVHVKQVKNPQKNFPKAMFFSVILILVTMIFGSLSIAIVLPQSDISLVDGVMQAFTNFFNAYHLSWMLPVIVVMLLIGSLGGMINWIISPVKGLLQATNHGFLPETLARKNKHGVASRLLLLQASAVTLLCSGFLLVPSVNGIYWLFTDLSTELYMLMYVLMFLAAIKVKSKLKPSGNAFTIPGGKIGYYATCALGLIGCTITLFVGFMAPSESIDIGSSTAYHIIFGSGILIMLLPVSLFYLYRYLNVPSRLDQPAF